MNFIEQTSHEVMIQKPDDGISWMIAIIVLAGVSGGIGGCAGAAHIFLTKSRVIRLMQVMAYFIIGLAMGIMSLGALSMINHHFSMMIVMSLDEMMAFSMVFGFGGSLVLSGTNILIRWSTKHFGKWEVKFTARQKDQERRGFSETGKEQPAGRRKVKKG